MNYVVLLFQSYVTLWFSSKAIFIIITDISVYLVYFFERQSNKNAVGRSTFTLSLKIIKSAPTGMFEII